MLVTYWTGEVYDYEVDVLSAQLEKNRFSGGTLVLQSTGLPRDKVLKASLLAAVITLLVGIGLSWGMGYGPSLFLAGAVGAVMGFFAISIFMVILINEFPDYPADRQVAKRNLVVRLGREVAAKLYALAAAAFSLSLLVPVFAGEQAFLYALPALPLAVYNGLEVLRGAWRDRKRLERTCGLTIVLNIATSLLLIAGLLLGRG